VGDVEVDDGVLVVKRIHVTYHLTVDSGDDKGKVDRAFRFHPSRCPVYRSIHPQIAVSTSLELDVADDERP
jgi:uncharacterized OsmC-like protein